MVVRAHFSPTPALTIVSPCILPVLPFVFARADRPFISNGLPLLAGMAATFAAVATLAAVGGGWAVQANDYGRLAALARLSQLAPNNAPGGRFPVVGSCKVGTTEAAVIATSECRLT
jgi:hypothetical protein